jgi:hypothetical protein
MLALNRSPESHARARSRRQISQQGRKGHKDQSFPLLGLCGFIVKLSSGVSALAVDAWFSRQNFRCLRYRSAELRSKPSVKIFSSPSS